MATLLLSAAGAAIGGSIGGSVLGVGAAAIGKAVGASIGGVIDQKAFGFGSRVVETGRIEKFRVQSSAEGTPVPLLTGAMRVAGQMIWSSNFKETTKTTKAGGGKATSGPKVTQKEYSYSVSVAYALGEGEISKIGRIWADGREIDRADLSYTFYKGDLTQLPDPVIASIEGLDRTPAYRGTSYIVFEDLQLADFGNRIPQLNFEVFRQPLKDSVEGLALHEQIKGVCLIPGTGEYSLATSPVHYGSDFAENTQSNMNSMRAQSDFQAAIEDLSIDLPNCESVSLVVSWFGSDLRCGHCRLEPKVEQNDRDGVPMPWRVSGLSRDTASVVSLDGERPIFGGTPSDQSVIEAITHLNSVGKKVVFYPFILMDIQSGNGLPDPWGDGVEQPVMPWRGRITLNAAHGQSGSPDGTAAAQSEVATFFGDANATDFTASSETVDFTGTPQWSYRRFILHYAHLCAEAGGVDLFCIGSEMRGLTQIRGAANTFPSVQELRSLANEVKSILGSATKVTYAADWSEYFGYHPNDGSGDVFFHLDPLWADPAIDVVAMDNYMPLSDWRDGDEHLDAGFGSIYNLDYLKGNIEGGEGFDWYYASRVDRDAQTRSDITDGAFGEPWVYRFKDIRSWWSQPHHERIGGVRQSLPTAWVPQSKQIIFTEYGCPAVDKGTNQPNVFYDPKSSESALPYYSNGNSDELIQSQYLRAISDYWGDDANNPSSLVTGQKMIDLDQAFVWAWDARPWPDFPFRLNQWSDGTNFVLGHWFSGRAHLSDLSDVVAEICYRCGISEFDVSGLRGRVAGFSVNDIETGRESLQPLMMAFRFTCAEQNGVLKFFMQEDADVHVLSKENFAADVDGSTSFQKIRSGDAGLPQRIQMGFVDVYLDYQGAEVEVLNERSRAATVSRAELPLGMTKAKARLLLNGWVRSQKLASDTIEFSLPPSALRIAPGDVVELREDASKEFYRIDSVEEDGGRLVSGTKVDLRDVVEREVQTIPVRDTGSPGGNLPVYARYLDLPLLDEENTAYAPYLAAVASPWPGGVSVYSSADQNDFSNAGGVEQPSIFARTLEPLAKARAGLWSRQEILVRPTSSTVTSVSEIAVFNGENAFAISHPSMDGVEIVQTRDAVLQPDGNLKLGHLLRGQLGTDSYVPDIWPAGAEIVFLSKAMSQLNIPRNLIGVEQILRAGPSQAAYSDDSYVEKTETFNGIGERPYAPVHLRQSKNFEGDVSLSWVRRTRIGGDGWQGLDVPLGEGQELYFIQVLKDEDVIREETVLEPNWLYSKTEQIADAAAGQLTVQVGQVSENYGVGTKTRIEISV